LGIALDFTGCYLNVSKLLDLWHKREITVVSGEVGDLHRIEPCLHVLFGAKFEPNGDLRF
jgi:hypothetical protein